MNGICVGFKNLHTQFRPEIQQSSFGKLVNQLEVQAFLLEQCLGADVVVCEQDRQPLCINNMLQDVPHV
jgi:hypothetical protein